MPSRPLALPELWRVIRQVNWLIVSTQVGMSMCVEEGGGLWEPACGVTLACSAPAEPTGGVAGPWLCAEGEEAPEEGWERGCLGPDWSSQAKGPGCGGGW